jgi:hypothetical protein
VRKQQLYGPDGILNNPEIAGFLQGEGTASKEALNIIRDMVTGSSEDLSRRIALLPASQRIKDIMSIKRK